MRGQIIKIKPFDFLSITAYEGLLNLNSHGTVVVQGVIKKSEEQKYIQLISDSVWTEISKEDENGHESVLFWGVATEGQIRSYGDFKELKLTVTTGSYLMDLTKHIRSFENADTTNGELLNYLAKSYTDSSAIINSRHDTPLGAYKCQYKETDWQFVKRIASECSAPIIPNYMNKGVRYYFGLPNQIENKVINDNEYSIHRYDNRTHYVVKRREDYKLGEQLRFQGKQVVVTKIHTVMEGNVLYHSYELTEAKDIVIERIYNEQMTGVSLKATVAGVKAEKVQLNIQENEYRIGNKKWFPYATVYSSPDGTGWYCMPEAGDCVRLYFPSDREDEAFVMNAVHLDSSDESKRVNPDYKSIMNKYGKEILITPSSIVMTNNAGMTVELADDKGISIISDKQVEIQSEDAITLMSTQGKIDMAAQNAVTLQQGNTSMVLSERLRMQGARVKME